MKRWRIRKWKALGAFFFGIFWFIVVVIGISLLLIPQLVSTAYGNDSRMIDIFVDGMESILDDFKEI